MKRSPEELQALVREYHQNLSEASLPFWMDVPDILDILDHFEQTQQTIEAEICLRIAQRMHPNDPDILMRKVYRLKNDGRWHEAEALALQHPQQEHIDVQFFLAEKALSELRFADANEFYEALLLREQEAMQEEAFDNPDLSRSLDDLYMEIAELFLDYGSEGFALKYLQSISADSPLQPRVHLLHAEILTRFSQLSQAEQEVERVIDEDPYNIDAWIFRAELANDHRDYDKCLEAAEYALAIAPNNEKALRLKAIAALAKEDWDTVVATYDDYHKIEPNDYTMSLSVGEIHLNHHKVQKGREVLQHAAQNCSNDNPDKQRILHDIAISHAMEGRIQQAYFVMCGMGVLGIAHEEILFQTARIALNYGFLAFGFELLRHRLEFVPIADERNVQFAQLLHECKLYVEAQDFWQLFFDAVLPEESEANVYASYAAFMLRQQAPFTTFSTDAAKHQPKLLQDLFGSLYPYAPAHDIPSLILKDYF